MTYSKINKVIFKIINYQASYIIFILPNIRELDEGKLSSLLVFLEFVSLKFGLDSSVGKRFPVKATYINTDFSRHK